MAQRIFAVHLVLRCASSGFVMYVHIYIILKGYIYYSRIIAPENCIFNTFSGQIASRLYMDTLQVHVTPSHDTCRPLTETAEFLEFYNGQ
jgi:hypothetical protein